MHDSNYLNKKICWLVRVLNENIISMLITNIKCTGHFEIYVTLIKLNVEDNFLTLILSFFLKINIVFMRPLNAQANEHGYYY